MKKIVLRLITVIVIASLFTTVAFAEGVQGSAGLRKITDEIENTIIIHSYTDLSTDYDVQVNGLPPDDEHVKMNMDLAKSEADAAGIEILLDGGSVEAVAYYGETKLVDGQGTIILDCEIPPEYLGYYLAVVRTTTVNGEEITFIEQQIPITSSVLAFALKGYGTYTLLITKDRLPTGVSPETGQTLAPLALAAVALMAIGGAVYAGKRRFN